jgi:hypothetical protein
MAGVLVTGGRKSVEVSAEKCARPLSRSTRESCLQVIAGWVDRGNLLLIKRNVILRVHLLII